MSTDPGRACPSYPRQSADGRVCAGTDLDLAAIEFVSASFDAARARVRVARQLVLAVDAGTAADLEARSVAYEIATADHLAAETRVGVAWQILGRLLDPGPPVVRRSVRAAWLQVRLLWKNAWRTAYRGIL